MTPRQRHPGVWDAAYGAAFVRFLRDSPEEGQIIAAGRAYETADSAVEELESILDRRAMRGAVKGATR